MASDAYSVDWVLRYYGAVSLERDIDSGEIQASVPVMGATANQTEIISGTGRTPQDAIRAAFILPRDLALQETER